MRAAYVLNGPNLGRLGRRQPEVYGHTTHADLAAHLVEYGRGVGLEVEVRQTDYEGRYIEWLHEAADAGVSCVLNAGAWTHYSYTEIERHAPESTPAARCVNARSYPLSPHPTMMPAALADRTL